MSKEFSENKTETKALDESESLLASGKGIWPLIIVVFLIAIYLVVSVVMLIISWRVGRI